MKSSQIETCTFVIFGATGSLSRLKLLPALYHLELAGILPDDMKIVGVGRRDWSNDQWQAHVFEVVEASAKKGKFDVTVAQKLVRRLVFINGDIRQSATFNHLANQLNDSRQYSENIVFYMAISPKEYAHISTQLGNAGLLKEEGGWRRVVIEKPFGYDLESAQTLQKQLLRSMREEQIYRIDHYLGKGMVQNVLVFRFANVMMEPLWNRNYIDHVQITHSETVGVGGRADYYDSAGALRDMIQSHLLQLLTLVAMEPPASLDAESLRDEKVKVLKSIRPIHQSAVHAQSFRAQYTKGTIANKRIAAYREEEGVPQESTTETYAALKLYIDNWRWRDVPFYLRTGKRMAEAKSAISICYKHPPQRLFKNTSLTKLKPDWVILGIQPYECVRMEMQVKEFGLDMVTRTTSLDASLGQPDSGPIYGAYEGLLVDVMEGDHSLFLRYDEVEWAWRVVDPVLRVWATERDFIQTYEAGSWGPQETRRLFEREDQFWRHSWEPDED